MFLSHIHSNTDDKESGRGHRRDWTCYGTDGAAGLLAVYLPPTHQDVHSTYVQPFAR